MGEAVVIYFVLRGLLDGEEGVEALTAGFGRQQADGWYYLPSGADDGVGPFPSRQAALRQAVVDVPASRAQFQNQENQP